jgi:hypothetical protein
MNEQLAFITEPAKICGTCHQFHYVGCFAGEGKPSGHCYKNRMPGNHFDWTGAYRAGSDCWVHSPATEARMLVKEMKRKGYKAPELDRLEAMLDK